jgi:hypothetical protein
MQTFNAQPVGANPTVFKNNVETMDVAEPVEPAQPERAVPPKDCVRWEGAVPRIAMESSAATMDVAEPVERAQRVPPATPRASVNPGTEAREAVEPAAREIRVRMTVNAEGLISVATSLDSGSAFAHPLFSVTSLKRVEKKAAEIANPDTSPIASGAVQTKPGSEMESVTTA